MDSNKPRRRFPWLKLALTVSLVLNLALVGLLAGLINRVGHSGSALRSAVAALPVEDRRALRRETGQIWREARHGQQRAQTSARLVDALRADEFDADAFAEGLREAQQRLLQISDDMHDRLVARVSRMSLEERLAYAEDLQEQMRVRRWRGGGVGSDR